MFFSLSKSRTKVRTVIIIMVILLAIAAGIWYFATQAGKSDVPPEKSVFVLQKIQLRGKI